MARETAVQFGSAQHLEGVLTHPDQRNADAPALILLSAGLLHKVGPNRLHPVLARRLARRGMYTLRFDMQGLGDSRPAPGAGTLVEQSNESVSSAMELITRETGVDRFILGGLCSGAEDSFRVGSEDARVVGVILLDGHGYATARYEVHRVWYRLRRKTLHKLGYYLPRDDVSASTDEEAAQRFGFIELPDKSWVTNKLRDLVERGAKMLYVYSGSWEYFNHRQQFFDMFPDVDFRGAATVHYFKDQDHTVTLRSDRERLIGVIEKWLTSAFERP